MENRSRKVIQRQSSKKSEEVICIFWLSLAIWVCIGSVKLNLGSFSDPGPGFLPFGAGLFLAIFAAIHFVKIFLDQFEEISESPWANIDWKKVICIIFSLFLYTLLLSWLGYLLATFFLMLFFFTFLKKMRWWAVIIYTLSIITISYLIFGIWLMIQFPKGILGIG